MYRVQVSARASWRCTGTAQGGRRALARDAERGETMPVAIALGGDPASIYAASAPLPPTIDEYLFAGFLRGEPVRLAKAVTSDLEVPAEAEIVIEGFVDPRESWCSRGRLAITPGSTRSPTTIPRCTLRR